MAPLTLEIMSEELKPEVLETPDVAQKVEETPVAEPVAEAVEEKIPEQVRNDEAAEEPAVEEPAAEAPAPAAEPTVGEKVGEKVGDAVGSAVTAVVNFGEKTLAQLSEMFQSLSDSVDRMKRSKEAEAIKSAFYKRLSKEKAEAGLDATVDEPSGDEDAPEQTPAAEPANEAEVSTNPFAAIENGFKTLYNKYKKERTEFN